MIKLSDLLNEEVDLLWEITAAEEAKKRGLKYAGFGKWRIPGGPTVAKTVDGKLKALKQPGGEKKPASKTPSTKGTAVSVKAKGTKQTNLANSQTDAKIQRHTKIAAKIKQAMKQKKTINLTMLSDADMEGAAKILVSNTAAADVGKLMDQIRKAQIRAAYWSAAVGNGPAPPRRWGDLMQVVGQEVKNKMKLPHRNLAREVRNIGGSVVRTMGTITIDEAMKSPYGKPIVRGEEIIVHEIAKRTPKTKEEKETKKFFEEHTGQGAAIRKVSRAAKKKGKAICRSQDKRWRTQLSLEEYKQLNGIQREWQDGSQYHRYGKDKQNRWLNNLITHGGTQPPTVEVPSDGLERGMVIHGKDVKKFLANIKIGKDLILPPSGFSLDPRVARMFGLGEMLGRDDQSVAVLLKIKPKKNKKTVGLALAYAGIESYAIMNKRSREGVPKKPVRSAFKNTEDYWDAVDDWDNSYGDRDSGYDMEPPGGYNDELEVIRPGSASAKVTSVTKHLISREVTKYIYGVGEVTTGEHKVTTYYVIELEDSGIISDKKLWKEAKTVGQLTKLAKDIIDTLHGYTNSSVHSTLSTKEREEEEEKK